MDTNAHSVTDNGSSGTVTGAEAVLARLRSQPESAHAFRGFGPLVLAVLLVLAMVLLAPSIAPERIVERPVDTTTTIGAE